MAVVAAAGWRCSGGQCVSHTLDPGQLLRSCRLPPWRRMGHFSVSQLGQLSKVERLGD